MQEIGGQRRTVAQQEDRRGELFQLCGQLLQRNGPVLAQADGFSLANLKERVVDLAAPRVHYRADDPARGDAVPGQRLQRGYADAGLVGGPGEALDRGHADADAGEGAGPLRHGEQVDVGGLQLTVSQQILRHRQQRAAVRQGADLRGLTQQTPVPQQRDGGGFGRGFKCEDQHSCAPSMVIFRPVSESFSMRTRISSPKKASSTFSLHSTAQTAPRAK